MSEEILQNAGFDSWNYGEELYSSHRPFAFFEREFENGQGQILRLEVLGPSSEAEAFLASLRFAFRIYALESELDQLEETHILTEESPVLEEADSLEWSSLQIQLSFPYAERPFRGEIYLDPIIGGNDKPHVYSTSKTSAMTATLTAISGSLNISVNNSVWANAAHGNQTKLTYLATKKSHFSVAVDGLEDINEYSLGIVVDKKS